MDFGLPTFHKGELPKPTNPRRKSSPRPEVSRVQCNSGFLNQEENPVKCTVKSESEYLTAEGGSGFAVADIFFTHAVICQLDVAFMVQ